MDLGSDKMFLSPILLDLILKQQGILRKIFPSREMEIIVANTLMEPSEMNQMMMNRI